MADECPDEEWVQRAAFPDGRIEFEPESWHGLYWDAWDAIRFERHYGAFGGELPLYYTAMRAYADDHGITGSDFQMFRAFMTIIDDEWLRHVAERDKDKKVGV